MLISQKLSFFSLSEILPPTSKGMQKYNKYVYSRQSSIGTIASVESSTWNKFPLKCKQTTSNSAWGPPPHLSSFHPSILPPFLPFTRPPSHSSSTPPTFEVSTFLSSTWSFFTSCVEEIEYEARRQRGEKKKKSPKSSRKEMWQRQGERENTGREKMEGKNGKGFPILFFSNLEKCTIIPWGGTRTLIKNLLRPKMF